MRTAHWCVERPQFGLVLVTLLTGLLVAVSPVHGQGYGVYEHGACIMGRGNTGVAEPCRDGTTIFVNPAGLVASEALVVSAGATIISGSGTFRGSTESASLDNPLGVAPHVYFQYGATERVTIGGGVYAPYGLRTRWPLDFGGRFVGYDSELRAIYIQPTVAYGLSSRVSIGGGPTLVVASSVDLQRREDLARVPLGIVPGLTFGALVNDQTDFVDTSLSASGGLKTGVHLGIVVNAHEGVSVGVRYLSKITLEFDEGTATFAPVGGPFRVTKPNPLARPWTPLSWLSRGPCRTRRSAPSSLCPRSSSPAYR
jgi:long-chain fatty acid transport protein